MTVFHIPTVFLVLGFLYLILPMTAWIVLSEQRSNAARLWCSGGEIFGVGLLLVGLRVHLPVWVSYPLANGLMWTGILMQVMALRCVLAHTLVVKRMAILILFCICVFEFFRIVLQDAILRFSWSALIFTAVFTYISFLSWRISGIHQSRSARWLAVVYAITAVVMFTRTQRALAGIADPNVVGQGIDSVLTVVTGLLISILGNFAFVGMFLERATQRAIDATAQRARQEESARLGEQIAQLERERTLGAMSYSFAHEFSQPLTAILMDTHAIKTSLACGQVNVKEISESIEDVERSANRTVELIARIRDFIRPTQGDYEYVDMKLLVRDVKRLLSHEIRIQKISFQWDFDEDACLVYGDKIQLSQIVLNLYRNAIQAMTESDDRKIFVALSQQNKHMVLQVRDVGPGLMESVRDSVGQPFVTTKEDGLGVGLSISKRIAENHSGHLTITNAVGGGAIAELNLPLANHRHQPI